MESTDFLNQDCSESHYDYGRELDRRFLKLLGTADEIKNAIEVNKRDHVQESFEKFCGQCEEILVIFDGFFHETLAATEEEGKKETSSGSINARRLLDYSVIHELKWTFNHFTRHMNKSIKVKLYEDQDDLFGDRTEEDECDDEEVKVVGMPYNINDWVVLKESFEKYYKVWKGVMVMVEEHLKQTLDYYDALEKKGFISAMVWHGMTVRLSKVFGLFKPKQQLIFQDLKYEENVPCCEEKKVVQEEIQPVFVEKVEDESSMDTKVLEGDYSPCVRVEDAGKSRGWEKIMDRQLKDSSQIFPHFLSRDTVSVLQFDDDIKNCTMSLSDGDNDMMPDHASQCMERLILELDVISQKCPVNDTLKKRLCEVTRRILLKGNNGFENTCFYGGGQGTGTATADDGVNLADDSESVL